MRTKYKVVNKDNKVIYSGFLLDELIETLILNHIKYLDYKYNSMTKIEKNYYDYFCELSNCYKQSHVYDWEAIQIIEIVYNNSSYIDESEYIFFVKPTIKFKKETQTMIYKNLR